jgi:hypothetical protein
MRHGELGAISMTEYLLLEAALCDCDLVCECGFDGDPEEEE